MTPNKVNKRQRIKNNNRKKPSLDILLHSASGKSYWPLRILFFIPGEMGAPWWL